MRETGPLKITPGFILTAFLEVNSEHCVAGMGIPWKTCARGCAKPFPCKNKKRLQTSPKPEAPSGWRRPRTGCGHGPSYRDRINEAFTPNRSRRGSLPVTCKVMLLHGRTLLGRGCHGHTMSLLASSSDGGGIGPFSELRLKQNPGRPGLLRKRRKEQAKLCFQNTGR